MVNNKLKTSQPQGSCISALPQTPPLFCSFLPHGLNQHQRVTNPIKRFPEPGTSLNWIRAHQPLSRSPNCQPLCKTADSRGEDRTKEEMGNGKSQRHPPISHLALESSNSPSALLGYRLQELFWLLTRFLCHYDQRLRGRG